MPSIHTNTDDIEFQFGTAGPALTYQTVVAEGIQYACDAVTFAPVAIVISADTATAARTAEIIRLLTGRKLHESEHRPGTPARATGGQDDRRLQVLEQLSRLAATQHRDLEDPALAPVAALEEAFLSREIATALASRQQEPAFLAFAAVLRRRRARTSAGSQQPAQPAQPAGGPEPADPEEDRFDAATLNDLVMEAVGKHLNLGLAIHAVRERIMEVLETLTDRDDVTLPEAPFVGVTDATAMPTRARLRATVGVAAIGRHAARAARLRCAAQAARLWRTCAVLWEHLDDVDRAGLAASYATGDAQRSGTGPDRLPWPPSPLVTELALLALVAAQRFAPSARSGAAAVATLRQLRRDWIRPVPAKGLAAAAADRLTVGHESTYETATLRVTLPDGRSVDIDVRSQTADVLLVRLGSDAERDVLRFADGSPLGDTFDSVTAANGTDVRQVLVDELRFEGGVG
ncbi:hypothetical protein AB0J72_30670 [Dactylosporangium sp. NPDC049742]|uniref:hypothetical protein n=1 Tax=Dactylosporangium sp. NPDC049742 TaxID=3154737 RepID=UPI0034374CD9